MKITQNAQQLFVGDLEEENDLSGMIAPAQTHSLVFLTDGRNITRNVVLPKDLSGISSILVKSSCPALGAARAVFVKDLDSIKEQHPNIFFDFNLFHSK